MKEKIVKFSSSYQSFKKKMIEKLSKPVSICKVIFGYGIMVTLFTGGLTLFGYIAALIIGGDVAAAICAFIYEKIFSVIIYVSSILVLLGLLTMYLSGETALTSGKKKTK